MPVAAEILPARTRPDHFLQRIESLRGLAALSVAVHHTFIFIHTGKRDGIINRGIIQSIFYGHGAVLCFFVLSGLVLGQSLRRLKPAKAPDFLIFYCRRILRIGPAFAMSLVFCLFLLAFFAFWKSTNPAASDFYFSFYGFTASIPVFVSNLFLGQFTLNCVTWSLYPELLGSLMLPFLYVASRTLVSRMVILSGLLALSTIPLPSSVEYHLSLSYLWMFYAGYLIADLPAGFWIYFRNNAMITKLLLIVAGLVCLTTPHFGHHPIPYVLAMGFIIAIVYGLPNESVFGFLDHHTTAFYGRISYSFYLFHFPVVYSIAGAMFNLFDQKFLAGHYLLMSMGLLIFSIGIATPISWGSYIWIEKPFVAMGKKLFQKPGRKMCGGSVGAAHKE